MNAEDYERISKAAERAEITRSAWIPQRVRGRFPVYYPPEEMMKLVDAVQAIRDDCSSWLADFFVAGAPASVAREAVEAFRKMHGYALRMVEGRNVA